MLMLKLLKGKPLFNFVEDSSQDSPAPSDELVDENILDDDGWLAKRGGAKNVREELKRRKDEAEELRNLRNEVETLKKPKPAASIPQNNNSSLPNGKERKYPPEIQEFYDRSIEKNVDEDYVKIQCDMAFKTTSASFAHTKNLYDNLSEVQQDFNERRLDRIVKNASEGKEKIKKLVAIRYAKEIEDEFKKLDVKLWGKAETQESVFGIITARHGDELTSEEPDSTVTKRLPSETSNAPGSKGVSGLSESDLQKAANLGGYDLDTPQGRKEAAEHAKRIKERDKNKKEFDNQ